MAALLLIYQSGNIVMEIRAAVAHQAGKPLVIETVDLAGPRAGDAGGMRAGPAHQQVTCR